MDDYTFILYEPVSVTLKGIPRSLSEFSTRNDALRNRLRELTCSPDTALSASARDRLSAECDDLFSISSSVNETARKSRDRAALSIAALLQETCRRNRAEIDQLSASAPVPDESQPSSRIDSLDDIAADLHNLLDSLQDLVKKLPSAPASNPSP